jgi:RNA ligase
VSYAHIQNLFKQQIILLFKEAYALEKIHGTSAHVGWHAGQLHLSPGGSKMVNFEKAVYGLVGNQAPRASALAMTARFMALGHADVTVYGEAYGGSIAKMSATYGKDQKFIVFDVKIGDTWLNVENAYDVAVKKLGLEFVYFEKIPCTLEAIDAQRDAPSVQAVRNGMGVHPREGIVLRPLMEFADNCGERVIAKHKGQEFEETATARPVVDPATLKVMTDADNIALEWVTDMRLEHVLQKLPEPHDVRATGTLIKAMVEDVMREAVAITDTKDVRRAIGNRASKLYRAWLDRPDDGDKDEVTT